MVGMLVGIALILGVLPAIVTGLVAAAIAGRKVGRSTFVLACGGVGFVSTAIAPLATKIGAAGALAFGAGGGLIALLPALLVMLWAVPASRVE
jgi:hypothetical protein